MPPPLFKPCVINSPFDGTLYNANMAEAENSFADLGPYVISGVTVSTGTGLSVNVASGTVSIGGRVTVASTTIAGLTDNTTNHLYLLNTGGGTSNTTGTPPANSVKIGTAVTAGGVVTSVSMGRTSGRQQFVQPQNLVLGGPAAGTASAGHPRAANLASWNATQAEGFELFGTLPAGALPAAFTAPATFTVTDSGTTNEPTIMTWQHRTSGTPAASFGNTVLFRADNASNSLADQLSVATGWSTAAAGSESSLAIFSIRRAGVNTEVLRLNSVGNGRLQVAQDFAHVNAAGAVGFFNATPITQPVNTTDLRTAIINLGFLASGGATPLNLNGGALTAATITGDCLGAVSLTPASVNRNFLQPTADTYKGLAIRGHSATQSAPLLEVFDNDEIGGIQVVDSRGFLVPTVTLWGNSVNAPVLQLNSAPGQTFADTGGRYVDYFQIDGSYAQQSGISVLCQGSILAGSKGVNLRLWGQSSTSIEKCGAIVADYADSTHATFKGRVLFYATDFNSEREALRLEASGTAAMIGFLGAAAVARAAAYTLAGSATRTFPTDPSGAFTGIASGVGGTPYAQLTDLNTLRTAVSTLIGVVRQMATDLGSSSGMGLLNA